MAIGQVVGPRRGAQGDAAEELHVPRDEVEGEEGPDRPLPLGALAADGAAEGPGREGDLGEVAAEVERRDVRLREGDERDRARASAAKPTFQPGAWRYFTARKTSAAPDEGREDPALREDDGHDDRRHRRAAEEPGDERVPQLVDEERDPLAHDAEREEPAEEDRRDEGDDEGPDGGREGAPRRGDAAAAPTAPARDGDRRGRPPAQRRIGRASTAPAAAAPAAPGRPARLRRAAALPASPYSTSFRTRYRSSHGARTWRQPPARARLDAQDLVELAVPAHGRAREDGSAGRDLLPPRPAVSGGARGGRSFRRWWARAGRGRGGGASANVTPPPGTTARSLQRRAELSRDLGPLVLHVELAGDRVGRHRRHLDRPLRLTRTERDDASRSRRSATLDVISTCPWGFVGSYMPAANSRFSPGRPVFCRISQSSSRACALLGGGGVC